VSREWGAAQRFRIFVRLEGSEGRQG
jgi:hypothetical protein